ncbi:5301_t:CDS:2 [Ambispora gerdemannii]|uniref:5301_t:CDS:1 n=1 Tax=Ambispora gerdemannii TaxID=144530 RepID=A0A9N8UXJ8_9GLOM|nr:5301_t:CDS:2 [Ambispora gerdemannii]
MNANLRRQLQNFFGFFLILSTTLLKDVSAASQPVQGHCSVTYKDRIYIFGGSLNDFSSPQNYFLSTREPFDTNNSSSGDGLEWKVEEQTGSTCVSYAACVTTSSGYLLVIGGIQSWDNKTSTQTFQIYDFNAAQWVRSSMKLNEPYPGASYGPRATFISTNLLFIYGGNTLDSSEVSFQSTAVFLDIGGEKWNWTKKDRSSSIDETDASYSGIITVNSNAWVFGGSTYAQDRESPNKSNKIYLFNMDKQWIPADVSLPLAVEHSAIGIRKNTLFIVGYSEQSLLIWSLDLVSRKFVEVSRNSSISVQKFAHAQFSGSDAIMLHGNFCSEDETKESCSATANFKIFNMTTRSWTNKMNVVDTYNSCITSNNNLDLTSSDNDSGNNTTNNANTADSNQATTSNNESKIKLIEIISGVDDGESGGDDILPTVMRDPSSQFNTSSSILSTEIDPFYNRSSRPTSPTRLGGSPGSRPTSPMNFRPEIISIVGESPKESQIMDDLPLPPPPVADHYAGRSSIGQSHSSVNSDNLPISFYSHESGNSSPPREYNL